MNFAVTSLYRKVFKKFRSLHDEVLINLDMSSSRNYPSNHIYFLLRVVSKRYIFNIVSVLEG